jgi:hypothetical protein
VDPDVGSMRPRAPSSWNRYSYVQGDPVNFFDSRGTDLAFATAEDCDKDPDQAACNDPCQPSADNPAPDPSCYQNPAGGGGGSAPVA